MTKIKVIAFDADDTLWVNETIFRDFEAKFYEMMRPYSPLHETEEDLFATEVGNIPLYGYGVKGYVLSMIECAMRLSDGKVPKSMIMDIIEWGKEFLDAPVELLDGVEETLLALFGKYKLVVATKGDLLDQQRKMERSGIAHYFDHIEVMSGKSEKEYRQLVRNLQIEPGELLMVGNSVKSDVLPVLAIGGAAVHVPYITTWAHEAVDIEINHPDFYKIETISELPKRLDNRGLGGFQAG